jgi:hypothetical protein
LENKKNEFMEKNTVSFTTKALQQNKGTVMSGLVGKGVMTVALGV